MPKIDIQKISATISRVAQEQIVPRFRKLAEGDVEMKGLNDPVTIADKETERHLTEQLTRDVPGSLVIGEETFARDPTVMAHVDSHQPVWIIDPIDGTRNFVGGIPEFAVMVALVERKKAIASWIHDPNSGDTVMAEEGSGVWLRSKKLTLAAHDPKTSTVGVVGARVKKLISDPSLMPKAEDVPPIEIGSCAGFDYPRLFSGEVNFADATTSRAGFLFYRHTNAWDHVPGLFLHREAGGHSADWDGKPYDMTKPRSGLLIAPDRDIWSRLYDLFEPLMKHTIQKAP